ncbi:MAG: tRNA-dependent cyclodipeptide synthase [Bacteriovoracaceae bacterium]|nr:tRNA-dependent cyclodipeptide synthase [Bacteriovoracaceae bacterium]
MQISPLGQSCVNAFEKKEHLCFGVSPFNSLFSQDYLEKLIDWSLENFRSFHFFLPDEPTIYTLEAMGYTTEEARRKMKKQINWLRNKMHKALESKKLTPKNHILDHATLTANDFFRKELTHVSQLFDTNENFRNICLESSRWVLMNKIDENMINEVSLLKAVKYFLFEIPMFAATNKIVGTETSLFCYHQSISFHEKLYSNNLCYKPEIGQGYATINV